MPELIPLVALEMVEPVLAEVTSASGDNRPASPVQRQAEAAPPSASRNGSRGVIIGSLLALFVLAGVALVSVIGVSAGIGIYLWRGGAPTAADKTQPSGANDAPAKLPGPATSSPATVPAAKGGQSIAALPVVQSKASLSYTWKPNFNYNYFYNLKTDAGEVRTSYFGSLNYKFNEGTSAHYTRLAGMRADGDFRKREGSGTAFVVHPDGLLVTCAHVVRGAAKVNVALGGKEYTGEVVGLDDRHDLALVRIAATKLPALPLADSEKVLLGEEVRAIGFPLSDVLGESVKVTRGSVSGLITQKGDKLLQVDAAINPGNSGGPLVNARGEVVGINSAVLVGEDVSSVGFAVPTNYALELIHGKGLALPQAAPVQTLDGPALAAAVTPAVAYVKVDQGTSASLQVLDYRGYTLPQSETVRGELRIPNTIGGHQDDQGEMVMTPSGGIAQCKTKLELPFLMLPLAQIPIEKLADNGEREWTVRRLRTVTLTEPGRPAPARDPFGRFDPRRGPRIPGFSQPEPSKVLLVPVMEQVKYKIVAEDADTLEIDKTLDLSAIERSGETPLVQIAGSGKLIWAKKHGAPQSLKQSMNLVMGVDGARANIPIEFDFELKSVKTDAEVTRDLDKYRADQAVKDAKKLDSDIEALRSPDLSYKQMYRPLTDLQFKEAVPARRDEVSGLIEPILLSQDQQVREAALHVLKKWGTAKNAASLIKFVDSTSTGEVDAAIEALAALGPNQEAAAAIAKKLPVQRHRFQTGQALIKMGKFAEEVVWPHLESKDRETRNQALQVLAEVGTAKSLDKLKALPGEKESTEKFLHENAIRNIERRVNR